MQKAWKAFWQTLASIFVTIGNVAKAGEKYSKELEKDAEFSAEKSEHKREARRQKWAAKAAP